MVLGGGLVCVRYLIRQVFLSKVRSSTFIRDKNRDYIFRSEALFFKNKNNHFPCSNWDLFKG